MFPLWLSWSFPCFETLKITPPISIIIGEIGAIYYIAVGDFSEKDWTLFPLSLNVDETAFLKLTIETSTWVCVSDVIFL